MRPYKATVYQQLSGINKLMLFLKSHQEQHSPFVCTVLGQPGMDGYIKHLIVLCG